ncbi:class IIb bacteriocin, lactobin A/cerein 7B family [Geofilum sp. OHC36d9]|uniref:class IIb bacteriocin, lactobin A/cerein 7B family n=1 Tax=Geofilum sp. OHC36d9 TaxID=3458413 RepID=UPI0040336E2D
MKTTLDLKESGIAFLDKNELKKTNGGFWVTIGIIASFIAVGAAIDYVAGEFIEGWQNPK